MASNDVITKADIEGLKVYIDGRIKSVEDRITGVENRITGVESRLTEATSEIKTEGRVNAVKNMDSTSIRKHISRICRSVSNRR